MAKKCVTDEMVLIQVDEVVGDVVRVYSIGRPITQFPGPWQTPPVACDLEAVGANEVLVHTKEGYVISLKGMPMRRVFGKAPEPAVPDPLSDAEMLKIEEEALAAAPDGGSA